MYSSIARLCILSTIFAAPVAMAAEPIVILKPPQMGGRVTSGNNAFALNPDHTATHKVQKNESLHLIIQKYYRNSGINRRFLELAIVSRNRHAFVRANPNFLYAGKTLHLPSVNEITAMVTGAGNSAGGRSTSGSARQNNHIYFHGF
jgi:Tfp pilus assembly protein FimV